MATAPPKFKLLKLPPTEDVILNKIEFLDQALLAQADLTYYDELFKIIIDRLYFIDPGYSYELNKCADKCNEARFWLNEFLNGVKDDPQ